MLFGKKAGVVTAKPTLPKSGYIPGLDGIRALAISLVLYDHTILFGQSSSLLAMSQEAGSAGVTIFFVLSGYLITKILLREEKQTGDISLPLFYWRRALRLFPALWLYLLVVFGFWLIGWLPHHPLHSIASSLLYIRNLLGHGHETDHLWSLSLEEQFYLLWPFMLVLLPHRNRARLLIAGVGLVSITAWRMYATQNGLVSAGVLYIRSDFRFDAPLFGCALALSQQVAPRVTSWFNSSARRSTILAVAGVAVLAAWIGLRLYERVYPGTDITVICLLAVVLLLSQVGVQGAGSRWLAWAPLVAIGQMSYGIYLWQQLFFGAHIPGFEHVRTFPISLVATFIVASISYRYLERPLIQLKNRKFHRVPAPNPFGDA
jgi:peptidoglycan/LPS O-acetylase OafA/YrhL